MKVDDIRKWLKSAQTIDLEIKTLNQLQSNLKSDSPILAEAFHKQVHALQVEKERIIKTINKIENRVIRCLLIDKYMNEKTFEQIAREYNKEPRWIYELHKRGIEELTQIMKGPN